MKNLIAVYQKFKHLDVLLSDKGWLAADDKIHGCCHELWMAIKAAQAPDMPTDQPKTVKTKCPFTGMAICREIRNDYDSYTNVCSYCSPISGEIEKIV